MGLRSKLVVGISMYLGLLAFVGLMGLYDAQVSLNGLHDALEHHVRELSLLANLSSAVGRVHSVVLVHVLTNAVTSGPAERAAYEAQTGELEREVDLLVHQQVDLQRRFGDQVDIDRFKGFRRAWHDYLRARDEQLLPLSREDRDVEALAVAQEDGPVDLAYERVITQLTTLQAQIEDESNDRLELAEQQFALNRDLLVLALLLAGGVGIVLGLWQGWRVTRAVRAVSSAARRVAGGDFAQHLRIQTGDEIESLAESFNVMTSNLQRMHDEQLAVERMKDEFVSMVSHELRTPLNGVIGMTDLLLRTELGSQAREYAEVVQRSGEVLLAIVNDILDLSKIEAGKLTLESVPVDVRRVVAQVGQLFAQRAQAKGLDLTWSIADAVPARVLGDQIRLRQVLLNLVGNALKFTEVGSVRLQVELLQETSEAALVRFEVTDTGVGIAPDARERIFEPFAQGDGSTTRKYGGTGLGLHICQRLVQLMGGTIGFDSNLGRGSTFWFSIPFGTAAVAHELPAASPPTSAPAPVLAAARPGQRLLLVEDSWINQQVALGMLEQLGYEADVAADGRQALGAIERTAYAAVLLDCQIPELDGYEVAAEVRRREALDGRPPVPLIAVTASAMAGDRERCLASGMNDHLAKPVRLSELAAVLRRWVPSMPLAVSSPIEAAPPTEQASPEVLDPTRLAEVARLQRPGRPDLVAAIIERFQAEAPRRLDALRDAARRGDALALSHCAHALKGDSRRIGGNEVGQLCAALEALGRSEAMDGAAELVAALGVALERLCRELQAVYGGAARGPRVSDAIPRLPDLAHSWAPLQAIE